MARSVRVEFPGAFYHVMARGNRREPIFLDKEDGKQFVKALGEVCAMTGWRVHAWVLLSNHYHLMIETPEANLVAGMKWLLHGGALRLEFEGAPCHLFWARGNRRSLRHEALQTISKRNRPFTVSSLI